MKAVFLSTVVLIGLVLPSASAHSAEYSAGDIVPVFTSVLFTRDAIGLTVQDPYFLGTHEKVRYFKANRRTFDFRQIGEEHYASLRGEDHFQEFVTLYEDQTVSVTVAEVEACRNHTDPEVACRAPTTKRIELDGQTYDVDMLTTTLVSDAKIIGDELWLGTFGSGGHGIYGAEGLLVASPGSQNPKQLELGGTTVRGIAVDPWSTEVWIVAGWQLAVVSQDKQVTRQYWPLHDIGGTARRPQVFVRQSDDPLLSNPLALFAYSLGERSYEGFANAADEGVEFAGSEPLYSYYMFGTNFGHRPQLPERLVELLDIAEPTYSWRKFACMLPGERAKELCLLDLDAWPTTAD